MESVFASYLSSTIVVEQLVHQSGPAIIRYQPLIIIGFNVSTVRQAL